MTDTEQQYEFSEFSGQFVDDGVVVVIGIYRPAGTTRIGPSKWWIRKGIPRFGTIHSLPTAKHSKNFLQRSSVTVSAASWSNPSIRYTDRLAAAPFLSKMGIG